jgi:HPt (histidine-containing phosphotransfer) domain-containing protein
MIDLNKNNEPLDLSYLREMSGDSVEFIVEMIDVFKEQTPGYIADLEAAMIAKDWQRVSNCAHKIKPTFAYLGREDAKDHMRGMEIASREQPVNEEALTRDYAEVKEFMNVLYKQLDDARANLLA